MFPYLTIVIFLPAVVALLVLCLPSSWKTAIKSISLAGSLVTFAVASCATWQYRAVVDQHNLAQVFGQVVGEASAKALNQVGGDEKNASYVLYQKALVRPTSLSDQERSRLQAAGLHDLYSSTREKALAASTQTAKHLTYVEHLPWIPTFGIHYFLAADGLSLPLLWLVCLLGVLCLVYSWTVEKATKAYFALFLLLQAALAGVFVALDFFLFYVFWELVLLPMYFLIGFWGGPRRIYAAIKFFIYTLVGSVLMLIAMIALYLTLEPHSFNVLSMIAVIPKLSMAGNFKMWIFLAMFIAFAIKVPVFPFHTWLPDAHVEAPTAASVVLAGVLLKMGGYGFFRFNYTLVPEVAREETFFYLIAILGLINIVYGGLCAMAQKDFKSLVAYSSVSHMGYVLLGMAAMTVAGMSGAIMQMFTHGLSSAMMFLLVGVLYDRAHHRNLDDFGGMGLQMPYYTGLATVGFFAALGLPGLCGFVSEALVFLGAWHPASQVHTFNAEWIVFASLAGIVLGAAYILWTIQRVFMGGCPEKYQGFHDLDVREWIVLTPLALLCILIGVYPRLILDYMDPTIQAILQVGQ